MCEPTAFDQYHKIGTREHALKAARDLCYGDEVIEKIKKAKNDTEIARILRDARINKVHWDD